MKIEKKLFMLPAAVTCLIMAMPLSQGCNGSRSFPDNTIQVVVSIDQRITLEGRAVEIKKLPARLKSIGATPDTTIRILVQKNTSKELMTRISSALATAGFQRILFTQPKQVEVLSPDSPKE